MVISRVCVLICTRDDSLYTLFSRLFKKLGVTRLLRFCDIAEVRRAASLILDRALVYDSRGDSESIAASRYVELCTADGLDTLYICGRDDKVLTEPPTGRLEASAYPCDHGELEQFMMRILYRATLDSVGRMPSGVTDINDYLKAYVRDSLARFGIKPDARGFLFLAEAIYAAAFEPELSVRASRIYERIAKTYNTTPDNVERMIRYAISGAWENNARMKSCVFADYIRQDGWQASNTAVIRVYSGLVRRIAFM